MKARGHNNGQRLRKTLPERHEAGSEGCQWTTPEAVSGPPDDKEVLGGIDAVALGRLYVTHQEVYARLAWRLLGPEDAADAVQQSFLRAWQSRQSFRGECALATWLGTILRHECLDRLRRRRYDEPLSGNEPANEPVIDTAIEFYDDNENQKRSILRFLCILSPAERHVVTRTLAGERLANTPTNRVARRRAVNKLRKLLCKGRKKDGGSHPVVDLRFDGPGS